VKEYVLLRITLIVRPCFGDQLLLMNILDQLQSMNILTCKKHIFHKNREISILTMKKKHSNVNTSSRSHRKFQTRKDKTNQKQQYEQ